MIKKWHAIHFIALFLPAAFGFAAETRTPGMIQMIEKEGGLCGTTIIAGEQARLEENTRRVAPDLAAALAKEQQTAHEVGDTLSFFTVNFNSSSYETIKAVCRKKGARSYIFVGTEDLEAERVDDEDIDGFYNAFEIATPANSLDPDKGILPLLTSFLGDPPNRSGDGYVYILIHDIKDSYAPDSGVRVYIAGYFSPTDQTSGTYSNRKDLINIDCYPQNPASQGALATVAHEFQHLVHNGRDPQESSAGLWVEEGCSEYSEVMCGYPLRQPSYYLLHPERTLSDFNAQDQNLWDYQKVALWTYYLGEKFGPELIGEIVKEPKHGIEGVRSALIKRGISLTFEQIFANFAVANYADNPALDASGYYAYNKIRLPSLPASTPHRVYPLSDQSKSVPRWAMGYIRFTGEDTTAVLHLQNQPGALMRARFYESGTPGRLEELGWDDNNAAGYSLKAIGRGADAVVMVAISQESPNAFTYNVTSEFRDNNAPLILSGPRELLPMANTVTIAWETDEPSSGLVEFGTTTSYGRTAVDTSMVTSHSLTLSGLQANTTYHYRLGVTDAYGNGPRYSADFQFTTTPAASQGVVTLQQGHAFAYSGRSIARGPDGRLFIVYHEVDGSRRFLYIIYSDDNGGSWSAPVRIDESLYHSGMASLAVDHLGRLHAAWHARPASTAKLDIYYSRSDDSGATWLMPQRLSFAEESNDLLYASVAVDAAGNPHVVWNSALYSDEYAGEIYYNYSADGGLSWSGDRLLSTGGLLHAHVPIIDVTPAGEAWVVWGDGVFADGTRNVYATHSSSYSSWSAPEKVSRSGVLYDRYPALVTDEEERVHVAWADNYTPGDIRILYTCRENGLWSEAAPVARSVSGSVSRPSLSCDNTGSLALLYYDDQGTAALGRYQSAPERMAEIDALAKPSLAAGDIYLALQRQGQWLPGANLSSDAEDNDHPETPRRMVAGSVDAIWMRTISASANQLNFLHLSTLPAGRSEPLAVTAFTPAAGASDVPYFKESFAVQVVFDQRIISDSLTSASFTVSGAAQGPITGSITWDGSQRRLLFQASQNLLPDDLITVRLKGSIPQESGVGLDGDGDGAAEGSPADDFVWSFRTQTVDLTPPVMTLGIAQNPVLTRHMDIYIFASEALDHIPTLEVAGKSAVVQRVPGDVPIYKADYLLEASGVLTLQVAGVDLAGNSGRGERSFAAQLLDAAAGGVVTAADGRFSLTLAAHTLGSSGYLTVVQSAPDGAAAETATIYEVGPAGLVLTRPAAVELATPTAAAGQSWQVEQRQPDGTWEALAGTASRGRVRAMVASTGAFRLTAVTEAVPSSFALGRSYPNPFRLGAEVTTFTIDLPREQEVEVAVYNLLGERVRTLRRGALTAGTHLFRWDGRDERERWVASGLYFYRCTLRGTSITRKLLILQ